MYKDKLLIIRFIKTSSRLDFLVSHDGEATNFLNVMTDRVPETRVSRFGSAVEKWGLASVVSNLVIRFEVQGSGGLVRFEFEGCFFWIQSSGFLEGFERVRNSVLTFGG